MFARLLSVSVFVFLTLAISYCAQEKNKSGSGSAQPKCSSNTAASGTPAGRLGLTATNVTFAEVTAILEKYLAVCKANGTLPAQTNCKDHTAVVNNTDALVEALGLLQVTPAEFSKVARWINAGKLSDVQASPSVGFGTPAAAPAATPSPC